MNDMKAIVFGATPSAKTVYMEIEKEYEIVALADNDPQKWGGGFCGYTVKKRTVINKYRCRRKIGCR